MPGLNDGEHLERTVHELAPLHPHIATVAIVPVGLTRHRERLPAAAHAPRRRGAGAGGHGRRRGRSVPGPLGTRFVFLADEVYLQAGRPLPPARAYEGFAVAEDGVGLVRRFEDDLARAVRRGRRARRRARRDAW